MRACNDDTGNKGTGSSGKKKRKGQTPFSGRSHDIKKNIKIRPLTSGGSETKING